MASPSSEVLAEFEAFAESRVASGKYASKLEVMEAAMRALSEQERQQAYDEACLRAAQEGEASGLAEGDIFEKVRAELGLRSRSAA